jgi:hypothetical protein
MTKIIILVLFVILGTSVFVNKNKNVDGEKINLEVEKVVEKEIILPETIEWSVPFTPQAPTGNWDDVKQGNGCEEASILMVYSWIKGLEINPNEAGEEIEKISDFSLKLLGHFHDISNEDTIKLMKEYFKYDKVSLQTEISLEIIKNQLAQEKILIVAINGDKLNNPNYQIPKPANHKIVIVGYDDTTQEFITNDPGTSKGKGFRYKYEQLFDSITDYPTGYRESFDQEIKSMIVIDKNETNM